MIHHPSLSGHKDLVFVTSGRKIPGKGTEDDPDPERIGQKDQDQHAAAKTGRKGADHAHNEQEKR